MPLITISGGIGCDVDAVAELLAREMKLPLLNNQKLQEEAEKMGFTAEEGRESLKDKTPGFINRQMTNKPEIYLDMMEAVIFEAAEKGNGVIPGHASPMLLHDIEGILHVRLYAGEKYRRMSLVEQQGISEEAARKIIHKSDNEKRGFMHYAFHKDWNDLSLYDIVINREKLDIRIAAKLIEQAVEAERIKAGMVDMEESLEKKALGKHVQTALLKAKLAHHLTVEVIEKDVIRVIGFADSREDREDIIRIVKAVPGVTEVKDEVAVYPVGSGV